MKKILFIFLAICALSSAAQEHAWVYFTDKPNAPEALANPSTILTQEAINRKKLYRILIDIRDVPVNEAYMTTLKAQPGITVRAKSKWFNCAHVTGTQTDIEALKGLPFVESVFFADKSLNPGGKPSVTTNPSKTYDKFQTGAATLYGNTENQITQLNLSALHQKEYTAKGIIIAVMDSGFPNVPAMEAFQPLLLSGNLLGGFDFVARSPDYANPALHSHGTRVLSVMAARIENNFLGTAPDASYYLFRTEDATSETPVEESYWVEAAERADSLGVHIINTSLGYSLFEETRYSYTPSDMNGDTAFITRGANMAIEKGMLVVSSAGNAGDTTWGVITAPADGNVYTAGAVDASGTYASFSSRGPSADGRVKPDGAAMGVAVAVVEQDNQVYFQNGTSFSAPLLAGALACVWQAAPELSNTEIMQLARETSSQYASPTTTLGYGIPDFAALLSKAQTIANSRKKQIQLYPNPATSYIKVDFSSFLPKLNATLYDMYGKKITHQYLTPENNTLTISSLSKGIYFIEFTAENIRKTFKIIKY